MLSTMCFDIQSFLRINSCLLISIPNDLYLRLNRRHSNARCPSIRVDEASTDNTPNVVSVFQGYLQGFEQDCCYTFTSSIPICLRFKRITATLRREKAEKISQQPLRTTVPRFTWMTDCIEETTASFSGSRIKFVPPTRACLASPDLIALHAS